MIHFDEQTCDMKSQSQAHGLAINIRFVIVNYHWLKGMFDSHHPGKKVNESKKMSKKCQAVIQDLAGWRFEADSRCHMLRGAPPAKTRAKGGQGD